MFRGMHLLVALFCAVLGHTVFAAGAESTKGIEERIQLLKKDVLELSRELSILEEELLYPSSTEIVVFVGMDPNSDWAPDMVMLHVDSKPLASHLYTKREARVLSEGGVQRLYQGNIREGEHRLKITVRGKGSASQQTIQKVMEHEFEKEGSSSLLEIRLSEGDEGIAISVKEWD